MHSVPSACFDLIKDNQKQRLMHCGALGLCLFSFCLYLPSPTDAKPPIVTLRALPVGVALRAPGCESTTAGHPRVGLACLAVRCHARLHLGFQLAFSLMVSLGFRPSRPSQHGHRFRNNSRLSCCSCSSSTRQSFSWPQPCIMSLRPMRPQLLDGLQALASLPN